MGKRKIATALEITNLRGGKVETFGSVDAGGV